MKLNKPYSNKSYADLAIYCNENGLIIEDKGDYLEAVEPPYIPPTKEEQSANREREYTQYVDPITSHIVRLKDEEQTPEVIAEIEELKLERTARVEEIRSRYPYPEVAPKPAPTKRSTKKSTKS